MTQVVELIKALEKKYKIDITRLLELYQEMTPREDMATILGVQEWTIRTVVNALNLRMAKRYRNSDYAYFLGRFDGSAEQRLVEELHAANDSLDQLSKDLVAKEVALRNARRETAKYRRAIKEPLDIGEVVREVLSAQEAPSDVLHIETPAGSEMYKNYTQLILLSDNHVEEVVSPKDVGKANEYNWGIMGTRLAKVFTEALQSYRGESKIVIASLGDQFSGVIHDTLEHTGKSLGEAVTEYAKLLASYIRILANVYEEVHVPIVHGNHGRLGQHKKSGSFGTDNFEYLMAQILKALVADLDNVSVDISTTGFVVFPIGDSIIGGHHGDFIRSAGDIKFMRVKEHFRQTLGVEPDTILQGHTHVYSIEQMPRGGTYVTNGSLIGVNGYSHSNGFVGKEWGQVIMSFLPSGKVENVRLVGNN